MSRVNRGRGVQKFWEARASGAEVDLKAILDEHPDEALELADAMSEAARQEDSAARERMWLARAYVLKQSGRDVSLGDLLRSSREEAGLSTTVLSQRAQGRGVSLIATAIQQLEADRAKVTNVRIPGLWSTLAEILQIDPHRLVATIRLAVSGPPTVQRFTRMERGSTAANRQRLMTSELPLEAGEGAADYIDWVRAELGLPRSPAEAAQ